MTLEEFEALVAEEFPHAIPEKFRDRVKNVAFLVEEEPSLMLRAQERLSPFQTLLGHYHGVPLAARGDYYGVGNTVPDTITLFRIPIENEALRRGGSEAEVRQVIRDTIWHEVGHHFGLDEAGVRAKEKIRRTKKA